MTTTISRIDNGRVLTGECAPHSILSRISGPMLTLAFMAPWLLMGGGMVLVGILALGPRNDISELWICLPPGIILLGLVFALLYWELWRLPQRTFSRFRYDGVRLTLFTPAQSEVTRGVDSLISIKEERGRFGRGLLGWWLRFHGGQWAYLGVGVSNAEELVRQINTLATKA